MAGNSQVLSNLFVDLGFRYDKRGVRQTERGLDRLKKRMDGLQRGLSRFGRVATIGGTAVTGALFGIGRGLVDFDREMNRLRRDTNATDEEFAKMRKRVIELGSSADYTTISVNDAARGLREFAKGGLSLQQAMDGLPQVLNLVAATEIDVGKAAAATAKIMKGFGLEVKDIARIHDLVAQAQVKTGITAEQVIDGLMRISATAKSTNISIEDMTTLLSNLVDKGQIPERAATSLERALVMLSKVDILPAAAKNAFNEMGVDIKKIEDLMAQSKIIPAFRMLADAQMNVSQASRIFGEDGQRAALSITANIDAIEKYRRETNQATGLMKKQSDQMNKGLSGAWAAFLSSLSAAREALGDAGLSGWLKTAATSVRELVEAFTTAPESVRRFAAMVLIAGPALLGLGAAIPAISFALGGLVPLLAGAGKAFILLKTIILGPFGYAISAIVKSLLLLKAIFLSPWILAIAGAALVITAAWKPISELFNTIWKSISEGAPGVMVALGPIGDLLKWLANTAKWAWDEILGIIGIDLSGTGRGIGKGLLDGISAAFNSPGKYSTGFQISGMTLSFPRYLFPSRRWLAVFSIGYVTNGTT